MDVAQVGQPFAVGVVGVGGDGDRRQRRHTLGRFVPEGAGVIGRQVPLFFLPASQGRIAAVQHQVAQTVGEGAVQHAACWRCPIPDVAQGLGRDGFAGGDLAQVQLGALAPAQLPRIEIKRHAQLECRIVPGALAQVGALHRLVDAPAPVQLAGGAARAADSQHQIAIGILGVHPQHLLTVQRRHTEFRGFLARQAGEMPGGWHRACGHGRERGHHRRRGLRTAVGGHPQAQCQYHRRPGRHAPAAMQPAQSHRQGNAGA